MQKKISTIKEKSSTFIASFFSVFFSLSILLEAKKYTQGYVFVVLAVFISLFLLFNEWVKVRELKKLYSGNRTFKSIAAFSLALLFSIGLSSIGIYFWTNDASERLYQAQLQRTEEIAKVNKDYQIEIDSIQSLQVYTLPDYIEASKTLEFWKTRNTRSAEERDLARKNVEATQNDIKSIVERFEKFKNESISNKKKLMSNDIQIVEANFSISNNNQEKNNFITLIFLGLILLTEIIILYLAKDLTEVESKIVHSVVNKDEYNLFKTALTQFFEVNKSPVFTISEFLRQTSLEWDACKKLRKVLERNNSVETNFETKTITLMEPANEVLNRFENTYKILLKQ